MCPRTLAQIVSNKTALLPRYIAAFWPQLSKYIEFGFRPLDAQAHAVLAFLPRVFDNIGLLSKPSQEFVSHGHDA